MDIHVMPYNSSGTSQNKVRLSGNYIYCQGKNIGYVSNPNKVKIRYTTKGRAIIINTAGGRY